MHTPENVRGKHNARSLTGGTSLYCLAHRPSHIYIESRDVVLDEGGPTYHYIILDHDGTPTAPDGNSSATALFLATLSLTASSLTHSFLRSCSLHHRLQYLRSSPRRRPMPHSPWTTAERPCRRRRGPGDCRVARHVQVGKANHSGLRRALVPPPTLPFCVHRCGHPVPNTTPSTSLGCRERERFAVPYLNVDVTAG